MAERAGLIELGPPHSSSEFPAFLSDLKRSAHDVISVQSRELIAGAVGKFYLIVGDPM
jgi:hypothetical protein